MNETILDPNIWTQQGGFAGLIVLSLFGVIGFLVKSQVKIHEMHREDLKFIQDLHRQERSQWQISAIKQHGEVIKAISDLKEAIAKLAERKRRTDGD